MFVISDFNIFQIKLWDSWISTYCRFDSYFTFIKKKKLHFFSKKSCLRKSVGEYYFITCPLALSNVYQNIFKLEEKKKQKKLKKKREYLWKI